MQTMTKKRLIASSFLLTFLCFIAYLGWVTTTEYDPTKHPHVSDRSAITLLILFIIFSLAGTVFSLADKKAAAKE
jgi:cbb3-type cytochrome oxidase subunit 3